VKKLEEICKIKTGFPFKSKEYSFGEGVKVVRGENVSLGFLRWDTLKTWDKDTSHLDDYWLSEYDILIGMDGSRVGRNRSFVYKHELPMLLAQRVAALSSIEEVGHSFLGQLILGDPFFRYVENVKTGTSIPHISAKQIKTFEVLLPSNNLAKNFSNHLKPTLEKQSEMIRETETLTQLRDTLLPQLISGKVRVPEEMVEKVGVQEKQNF
jgi:type I restriction enzyme S subunit